MASFASRRAISVLPTPVGPIIRMFLGTISSATVARQLLAPPAVAQRDRHRALGGALADDVLVELGDDLPRRQVVERELRPLGGGAGVGGPAHSSSRVRRSLV